MQIQIVIWAVYLLGALASRYRSSWHWWCTPVRISSPRSKRRRRSARRSTCTRSTATVRWRRTRYALADTARLASRGRLYAVAGPSADGAVRAGAPGAAARGIRPMSVDDAPRIYNRDRACVRCRP